VWDVSDASGCGSLRLSWTYNGVDYDGEESEDLPGVTAVEAIKVDLKKVAVAYQNTMIKIFDVVHGKELAVLHGESGSGKWCGSCGLSFPPHLVFQTAGFHNRVTLFHTQQCPFLLPPTRTSI
jgi:striatin 1/3/4